MKILLLNPHIDAQHKIAQALKARGMALLVPSSADEAWQVLKLHGASVDLAILHREGVPGGDPGIALLAKIKKDPTQADLPILLTSETWGPEQCANHQQTPMGANAYLRWPFDEAEILKTVDAIFGAESSSSAAMPEAPSTGTSIEFSGRPQAVTQPKGAGQYVLEEPSGIFEKQSQTSIKLDAPEPVPSRHEGSEIELSNLTDSPALETSGQNKTPEEPSIGLELPSPHGSSLEISTPIETAGPARSQNIEVSAPEASVENQDSDLVHEMPYLFSKGEKSVAIEASAFARAFVQPVGDAVIPGGAANSPDTETLKKYLMLREQDVAALSAQLKAARDELSATKSELASERAHGEDLQFKVDDQNRKIEDFEREKALALEGVQAELEELRFQAKAKTDKAKLLEIQVNEAAGEIERLKERVRSDIRKIRVRERELENKLEIAKKDSEAILAARENKIIELKRKLDLLEFNMDLLQDRYAREKESSAKLREKLSKAAQVVRVAEGLLDEPAAGTAQGAPASGNAESKAS